MKKLKNKKLIGILLLVLGTVVVMIYAGLHYIPSNMDAEHLNAAQPKTGLLGNGQSLLFDVAGGIYDAPVTVTMSAAPNYEIYYTLDGTNPMEQGTKYTEPVTIGNSEQAEIITLTAYGRDLEEENDTVLFYETFFINTDIEQYGMPVFAIQVSEEEFSSENGIYTTVMDAISAPKQKIPAYVQFFDETGVSQNQEYIELSMHGSGSLAYPMKSMRLYFSRKAGDESVTEINPDSFFYDPFEGRAVDTEGNAISSYKHLLLRNGGNDCGEAMLRDSLMARIGEDLSLDTMAGRPALVYMKGEFWGLYNLRERYDAQYFMAHYGVAKENVVLLETPSPLETHVTDAPYTLCEGVDGDEDSFNDLVAFCRENDLTDPDHYNAVCDQLDTDSLIDFVCANLYFANMDWPANNVKVWRNKNAADESGMDTKWHFLLVDMDCSLGMGGDETVNLNCDLYSETAVGYLMKALLANESFREKFMDRYCELIQSDFAAERTVPILDEMAAEMAPAISLNVERWQNPVSVEEWESEIGLIRDFLNNRSEYALTYLQEFQDNFGWMILGEEAPNL